MFEKLKNKKKALIIGYIAIGIVYSVLNLPNLIRTAGDKKYLNLKAIILGVGRLFFWPIFGIMDLIKKFVKKTEINDTTT